MSAKLNLKLADEDVAMCVVCFGGIFIVATKFSF